ncbi:MAG: aminopeptidase [Clostridiales bacterium]|mgnify:FL=1|nr:aminopeptidase [Clostridiales bacterium]
MNKTRLRKYAKLIADTGVKIQKGQDVIIQAETDQPDFVYMVVEECYRAGARKVSVEFSYNPIQKLHTKYRKASVLASVEDWEVEKLRHRTKTLPCMIYLLSEDPDGLKGMNQEKYGKAMQERFKVIKPFRDEMDNKYQWCIAAVPGKAWAKKIFPNDRPSVAVEKLWEAILTTSRCVSDDPIKEWEEHNRDLEERCKYLNSLKIKTLVYKASNGTDLRVGMIPQAKFMGGGEYSLLGNYFNPNIPSEECFTTPMKGMAEGIVFSSKPLSYRGQLIDNFSIRFSEGKAIEVHAEQNEELLRQLITADEGSGYLGECALVPYDSPIRNSGLLFYNTLFDENAACHLALGRGFTNCIENYENYTKEELHALGVNDSMLHEDFMIGTKDLSITAETEDGKKAQIFKDGNWAF